MIWIIGKIKLNRFRPPFISKNHKLASHNLEHEHLRLKTRKIFRLRVCLVSFTLTFIAIQNLIIICRLALLFNFVHQNILMNSLLSSWNNLLEVFVGRRRRCIFDVDRIIAFFDTYHFLYSLNESHQGQVNSLCLNVVNALYLSIIYNLAFYFFSPRNMWHYVFCLRLLASRVLQRSQRIDND